MARLYTYTGTAEIARENLALAVEAQEALDDLLNILEEMKNTENEDYVKFFFDTQIIPIKGKLAKYSSISIVFAALTVEAYIYDYAVRKLTYQFVDSHIDRLDVISKWVIVTKLATGKDFPKTSKAFQSLKKLVRNRNYIIHSKSVNLRLSSDEKLIDEVVLEKEKNAKEMGVELENIVKNESARKFLNFGRDLLKNAQESIETLDELAIAMESLDPDEYTSFYFQAPVGKASKTM